MRRRVDPKSFDLTTPCPLCGYKIDPSELLRVGWGEIKCPKCGGVFDSMAGITPQSTS